MAARAKNRSQSDFQRISLSELRCVARPDEVSWMQRFDSAVRDRITSIKENLFARQPKEPVIWIFSDAGEA